LGLIKKLQRQTSGFRCFALQGVHFVQSRRIASELKARAVFTLATSAQARGRNRFGNLLRTQVWKWAETSTCCSLADQSSPGALLSLKSLLISRTIKRRSCLRL
jgi:hypothetical protein